MTTNKAPRKGTMERRLDYQDLDSIEPAPNNPKEHQIDNVRASIDRFGYVAPMIIDDRTGRLVVGHGRLESLKARRDAGETPPEGIQTDDTGRWLAPVIHGWASRSDADAAAYLVLDNRQTELGGWDHQALVDLLDEIGDPDLIELVGWDPSDLEELLANNDNDNDGPGLTDGTGNPSLANRFGVPPFDVLDARQDHWRDRKRSWLRLGIKPEISQGDHAPTEGSGTDIRVFDPVLCELVYRWFTPPGGHVLDPFAGGSVRGIVAAATGRQYHGIDLSASQLDANRIQARQILAPGMCTTQTVAIVDHSPMPKWTCGDSAVVIPRLPAESVDLVFTCPPSDLSTMGYGEFDQMYEQIIGAAAAMLRPDRFAVIVTSDTRDQHGTLHDLRGETIRAAIRAGLRYVNGAVLVTPVGLAAVTVARGFVGTRTLGRVHQDVLVFVKGDRKAAAVNCGDVELELDAIEPESGD